MSSSVQFWAVFIGDWVGMHRYDGTDRAMEGGMVSSNGTSELPMRNQFKAWKQFMAGEAAHAA